MGDTWTYRVFLFLLTVIATKMPSAPAPLPMEEGWPKAGVKVGDFTFQASLVDALGRQYNVVGLIWPIGGGDVR